MTGCASTDAISRLWLNFPRLPSLTLRAKYPSDSARTKLSTVTGSGLPTGACAWPSDADATITVKAPTRTLAFMTVSLVAPDYARCTAGGVHEPSVIGAFGQ